MRLLLMKLYNYHVTKIFYVCSCYCLSLCSIIIQQKLTWIYLRCIFVFIIFHSFFYFYLSIPQTSVRPSSAGSTSTGSVGLCVVRDWSFYRFIQFEWRKRVAQRRTSPWNHDYEHGSKLFKRYYPPILY